MIDKQTAPVDELAAQAAALDQEAVSQVQAESMPPEPDTPPPQINDPAQLSAAITLAINAIKPMFPSLGEVYTPETIQNVALSSCTLANKHGWNIMGMLAKYAEEIQFALVIFPVAIGTYKAVDQDMQARKAANDASQPSQHAKPVQAKGTPVAAGEVNSVVSGQ